MELRQLRYFATLAEELHFGRAAARLHMAQPPLSQQISKLETELGFLLFHRTKRFVQLTEAGQLFLRETQQILRQLEQAVKLGQQASRGEVGQLVLGFVGSATYNILPKTLQAFRTTFPAVNLELHELTTDQQLEWLREGRIDVGFLRPPVAVQNFAQEIVFREPLIVALPETHSLARQNQLALRWLSGEPFILFPRPLAPALYDQIISLCQQAGFSPQVVQEAIQMQTIVSLVAAELGLAIVPASVQRLQRPSVVYRPLQESTPMAEIAMIYRSHQPSPTLCSFTEVVRQVTQPSRLETAPKSQTK